MDNSQELVGFIWSVADLLRGDYKQSEYGRVMLPFTVLRRLDCVLEPTKAKVLENALGLAAVANVTSEILQVDGHDHCRLHVEHSGHPVLAKMTVVDSKGRHSIREAFFVRLNNATKEISDEREIQKYIAQRWGVAKTPSA